MEKSRNDYLDFILKTKGVSRDYAKVCEYYLKRLCGFFKEKGLNDIAQVMREHLDEYQKLILRKDYASPTKHSMLLAASLFFRYLYDYGHIKENIGLVIELPKMGERIPRNIMNEKEVTYLQSLPDRKSLIGMRDMCIMKLLYSSAMRPKEIFKLTLDDIDFKRKQAIVRRPKNKRDRVVHFDRYTTFFIKKYLKEARPWFLKDGTSRNLFISATGSNLSSNSWAAYFSQKYKTVMEEKFKKIITPYAFRHSSATHWLDSGAKQKRDVLPYIQRQLGHESLESTTIYTHVAIEPLREMFRKYHPRNISLKKYHRVPSPEKIIAPLKDKPNQK